MLRKGSAGTASASPSSDALPLMAHTTVWSIGHDANLLALFALATVVKLFLVPTYHSTDFEVHRNWMAITSSLPLSQWYHESTSQWTLDYPPFFAWFEWILSQFAGIVDKNMLVIQEEPYLTPTTVIFQRLSVIVADAVLFIGVRNCCRSIAGPTGKPFSMAATIVLSAGLFIVDHIHFQYNGFLFGILLQSIASIYEGHYVLGGVCFAILLNLKHIFLYVAPAYFVFLLRAYCFKGWQPQLGNFLKLSVAVASVFCLSFGPFVINGGIGQVIGRLFPFKRGLVHAYWAANFWALYAFADRVLIFSSQKFGLPWALDQADAVGSVTRGIVGDIKFAFLPEITPQITFIVTLIAMTPSFVSLWRNPSKQNFVLQLVNCALSSFVFGWHVHEKAILNVLIPLSVLTVSNAEHIGQEFIILTTVGEFALFPLLFGLEELPLRVILWIFHILLCTGHLYDTAKVEVTWGTIAYLGGLGPVLVLQEIAPFVPGLSSYQFLPLMLVSVYCAIGVCAIWVRLQVITAWWYISPLATADATGSSSSSLHAIHELESDVSYSKLKDE